MDKEVDLRGQGTQASLNVPVRREGGGGGMEEEGGGRREGGSREGGGKEKGGREEGESSTWKAHSLLWGGGGGTYLVKA